MVFYKLFLVIDPFKKIPLFHCFLTWYLFVTYYQVIKFDSYSDAKKSFLHTSAGWFSFTCLVSFWFGWSSYALRKITCDLWLEGKG